MLGRGLSLYLNRYNDNGGALLFTHLRPGRRGSVLFRGA